MKYNYPVKYTAMPIIEQVGWNHGLHELERAYDVVCYIVSKCYLISDRIKYKENGESEKEYEVVFPYENGQYSNSWEKVTPSFNHGCVNSTFVEKVFDTYDDALEFATNKNKDLCEKTWIYLPYTKDMKNQIAKKVEEFNDKLSRYKLLEQQILFNTADLEQSKVKKLDKLIKKSNGEIKVLGNTLYNYLTYSTYSSFIVYSISKEQYNQLLTLIINQDSPDISSVFENASPILYHDYKIDDKNIMVIDKNGNILYYLNEWESLISNDDQELPPIKLDTIDKETEYLFTTETLEDIILSFNQPEYINLSDIKGPILKKSLLDKKKK